MSEQPPGPNPYQPQQPYSPYGAGVPWGPPPDHPQAATVLVLGILGFALCQVVSPFAWVMGSRVKREIAASNGRLGGQSIANIGYILGIVGSCLLGLFALAFLGYLAIVVAAISSS